MTGPPCQHERAPATANNPNPQGCRKCARRMPPEHDLPEAPKRAEPRRDLHRERQLTRAAALDVGADVEKLIGHAEARAAKGAAEYGGDTAFLDPARDLGLAGAEEGSDWRNYLLWIVFKHGPTLSAADRAHLEGLVIAALGFVARAYEVNDAIRELLRDAPNHPAFDPEIGRTTDHGTW